MTITTRVEGKGGWMSKLRAGESYTCDLAAWGTASLDLSRESDSYRESTTLWDGTHITSSARLSDHHD